MYKLQQNLSKADTLGTNIFVRFRKVSVLDRLCLWDFDQQTDISGQNLLSGLGRCLLSSRSALDRFYSRIKSYKKQDKFEIPRNY